MPEATDRAKRRKLPRWLVHPLILATALVVVAASAGLLIADRLPDGKEKEGLQVASITLIYGALLGGVVKLLLDDFQSRRVQRADQAKFITNVLADLKSVYDRVERVRVLVPAHRSALTYGNEMRDLIDAQVQLRNVARALDQTSRIKPPRAEQTRRCVKAMETYLSGLTAEFRAEYKNTSDKQSEYQARVKKALESAERLGPITNEAWTEIAKLDRLNEFITVRNGDDPPPTREKGKPSYELDFEDPLDAASWLLRDELRVLDGMKKGKMPKRHGKTLECLSQVADDKRPGSTGDPARSASA